ncbi:hypothetical protein FQR65_LT17282 [Abscondita terminalis]|nr:hypothetical protein FQR65_LT17282 [Abscondita terminalis]
MSRFEIQSGPWSQLQYDAQLIRRKVFIEEQNISEAEEWDDQDAVSLHFVMYEQNQPIATARLLQNDSIGRVAVWLKMEALQPAASFKQRSISYACQKYFEQGAQRFVSSSGGNAGLAVAYTGRQLGVPVTVVVPETTAQRARELIAQQGAEVIVHGASWGEANALAQSLLTQNDVFIHPFDDPLLWEGIIPMIDEVIAEGVIPDAVVLSVGGGSLLSGVVAGLNKHGLGHVPVYAVETQGTASLNASAC